MKKIDLSFTLYHDGVNKLTFFSGLDILIFIFWFTIVLLLALYVKSRNSEKEHYRYFIPNLLFKIFFSLVFAFYYILFIKGGDSIAFFDTSRILTNLMFQNFDAYINEWPVNATNETYIYPFSSTTGFPPGWIIREAEGYFVSKLFSVINILTRSSYFSTTLLVAFLTSLASFKLYNFVVSFGVHNYKVLAVFFLFIPSLSFWCTGVSKDSLLFICICYLIPIIYNLATGKAKSKLLNILYILLISWILMNIRSFMLYTVIVPFIFAFNVQFSKRMFSTKSSQRFIRTIVVFIGFGFIGFFFSGETAQKYLKEAEVTQQDFMNNSTYTGAKYNLGNVSYTPLGMLRAMPLSVFTGIYRPFPWEALSPGLILNGLESIIMFYLTFVFLTTNRGKRIGRIRESDILTFSLYFVIIFAFMTGFTSVIFGVLVRLRAPLLPFFIMLLTVQPEEEKIAVETAQEAIV
jgi:hypothetical protein